MNYIKNKYRLLVYLTSFTVFISGDIKKKKALKKRKKKKSSENDQLTGQSELFYLFFLSPDPKSDFFPINQLIKKFWPY